MSNLTPAQIIATLSTIGKDIDDATDEISRLDELCVRARAEYRLVTLGLF